MPAKPFAPDRGRAHGLAGADGEGECIAARRKLYIWLDGNVPFYGTYEKDEQAAQREGRAVAVPKVQ